MTTKVIEDVKAPSLLPWPPIPAPIPILQSLYMILKDPFKKPEMAVGAKSQEDSSVICTY